MNSPRPVITWSESAEVAMQDCACPSSYGPLPDALILSAMADLPQIKQEWATTRWQKANALYQDTLTDQHVLIFNPARPGAIATLNHLALQILAAFSQPIAVGAVIEQFPTLTKEDIWRCLGQLVALQLIHPLSLHKMPSAVFPVVPVGPTTLTAWLHITNACDFRCTYCYINKTTAHMDVETGKAAVDAIFSTADKHGFTRVQLKYAGGEATLNFPALREIHVYAYERAAAMGIILQAVLLSNGARLKPAMLDFLRTHQIRLSISLDGLDHAHDLQRLTLQGGGTAAAVVQGIEQALALGIRPYLSITVTAKNAAALSDVVRFALKNELLFNLNFYREHTTRATTLAQLRAEDAVLIQGTMAALEVIEEQLPTYSIIGALVDRANFAAAHTHACGAGHNYLVVDHKGQIARCQMEIEQPITSVHSMDPLTEIRLHAHGFQNVSVDEKTECQSCDWRYWCAGGCPQLTYHSTGRTDVKSPYCEVYKAIYPTVLRLEGLRQIRKSP